MSDLFAHEEAVLEKAKLRAETTKDEHFKELTSEYGKLLKQLILTTKLSDRTTKKLNELHTMTETQNQIISDRNSHLNYEITKYELANRALNSGLWDIPVIDYEPDNLETEFYYTDRIRYMLGFTDEKDFPNIARSLIGRIHPDDLQPTIESFYGHLNDKSQKTDFDIEIRIQSKDGEYRWFRKIGEAVRDNEGTPQRMSGLLIDIDKQKQLEVLRQKAQEQEMSIKLREEQVKTVVAMAVTANHEINQHLHVMSLAFDILKAKFDVENMDEKAQKHWNKVENGTKAIAALLTKYKTQHENFSIGTYLDDIQMINFGEGEQE